MLICKTCYLKEHPEEAEEPFSPWQDAQKVWGQCEICERSTQCAEL